MQIAPQGIDADRILCRRVGTAGFGVNQIRHDGAMGHQLGRSFGHQPPFFPAFLGRDSGRRIRLGIIDVVSSHPTTKHHGPWCLLALIPFHFHVDRERWDLSKSRVIEYLSRVDILREQVAKVEGSVEIRGPAVGPKE